MINKQYITLKREPFFEIARKFISDNSKCLDIGPGDGQFADYCKKKDIYLLDSNENTVKSLKEQYSNVFLGTLPELPFDDNYFDLIHISHVLEHLSPSDVYNSLNEMNRCCKPGGVIVISGPLLWYGFYNDLSHSRPYNPMVFEKYLCRKSNDNFTRKNISHDYTVETIQYRYIEEPEELDLYRFSKVGWLIKRSLIFIRRRLYKKYLKTGFTMALRKSNSN